MHCLKIKAIMKVVWAMPAVKWLLVESAKPDRFQQGSQKVSNNEEVGRAS
jgi:hypothetical protein